MQKSTFIQSLSLIGLMFTAACDDVAATAEDTATAAETPAGDETTTETPADTPAEAPAGDEEPPSASADDNDTAAGDDTDDDTAADGTGDDASPTDPTPSAGGFDASAIVGRVYAVDLTQARITEPSALGAYASRLFAMSGKETLVSPVRYDASAQALFLRTTAGSYDGDDLFQDFCEPTVDLASPAFVTFDGAISHAADALDLYLFTQTTLFNAEWDGTFDASGEHITGVTVSGLWDTRAMASMAGDYFGMDSEGAICTILGMFGSGCTSCTPADASTDDAFCVELGLDQASLRLERNIHGLTANTSDDIAANADCQD